MPEFDREKWGVVLLECLVIAVFMVIAANGLLFVLRLLAGGWHEWI